MTAGEAGNPPTPSFAAGERLQQMLALAGLPALTPERLRRFEDYFSLIVRWNSRTNLTAVRDPEGILARHFAESIACAYALPAGIRTLLDFGSGAGFPGIPIALVRPEIAVTLAESQGKKAAFLQEAVRVLGVPVKVHAGRAEELCAAFDLVILRAVDKMAEAVAVAARLVTPGGWLALMTTEADANALRNAAGTKFAWKGPIRLCGGESRVLDLGQWQGGEGGPRSSS